LHALLRVLLLREEPDMPYGLVNAGYRCSDVSEDGAPVRSHILFVGGLGQGCPRDFVVGQFQRYGRVVNCELIQKGRAPGMAFVHFENVDCVDRACNAGGMQNLRGKVVEIRRAVPAMQTRPVIPEAKGKGKEVRPDVKGKGKNDGEPCSLREQFLRERQAGAGNKRRKSSSSSSSSSSGKKRKRKKDSPKKNDKPKKRRRSSSSSSSKSGDDGKLAEEPSTSNPEIESAKKNALEKLTALKCLEKEARLKQWRALLREWHPDKNPERVELATAVFQFLQKGRVLLGTD